MSGEHTADSGNPRRQHDAARRREWFGLMYIGPEVVDLIAPGEKDQERLRAACELTLLPILDGHYEASWPNLGSMPYASVYAIRVNGEGPLINIEVATWPGERTTVNRIAESPAERRGKPGIQTVQNPD